MKRLYPSNSQFPHFVPVLGSLVLIICDKSLNTLLIVSCVFVDVKFMHKKESQSPPARTLAFLVRALRLVHSLAVLFLIFFLFFFQWSSCKEKENLSETISSTPQIFLFFPWSWKLWSFGFTGGYISPLVLLIVGFRFVVLGACCQVLPIFVCGRALARLSVSYVLWNVHGVIRVQRDAVVIRALGQVLDRFFFLGLFLVCVCVCVCVLSLSLSRLVCRCHVAWQLMINCEN